MAMISKIEGKETKERIAFLFLHVKIKTVPKAKSLVLKTENLKSFKIAC